MINRGYKDPWRHPHKLAGCHSELSGVVTPQGHSANLLRSVIIHNVLIKCYQLGGGCEGKVVVVVKMVVAVGVEVYNVQ